MMGKQGSEMQFILFKFNLHFSLSCKSFMLTASEMDPNLKFMFKYGNNSLSAFHVFDPLLRWECALL